MGFIWQWYGKQWVLGIFRLGKNQGEILKFSEDMSHVDDNQPYFLLKNLWKILKIEFIGESPKLDF